MRIALRHPMLLALAIAAVTQSPYCFAEDAFFEIPLSQLKITAGKLPDLTFKGAQPIAHWDPRWQVMAPVVVLDGPGEGYADIPNFPTGPWFVPQQQHEASSPSLLIHASKGKDVTGRMSLPKADGFGMTLIRFEAPGTAAKASAREAFYRFKLAHYQLLQDRDLPGTAWFRHVVEETQKQLPASKPGAPTRPRFNDPLGTYDLFSGGRAVSENLQLNRPLRGATVPAEPTINLDTLQGITVAEIDWKPLLKDAQPKLDPLAKLIPADQHVIFFPSFNAASKLADEGSRGEVQVLQLADPRSEDANIVARYERQLGLSLTGMGRLLGPSVIGSVALTGSDPYFLAGTDVAVLFQSEKPKALAAMLIAQVKLASAKEQGVAMQAGKVESISFNGFRTPDRLLCSYVAALDGSVVVTNSLAQLGRLARVGGDLKSIASLDEYRFFRLRYPLGDKSEAALRVPGATPPFVAGVRADAGGLHPHGGRKLPPFWPS